MIALEDFRGRFDVEGRYRDGTGMLPVIFLTNIGSSFPGKLIFQEGLCVRAEMNGSSPWGYPDNSPIHGLRFTLQLDPDSTVGIQVNQGRIVLDDLTSKQEFLSNFRLARSLFVHPRVDTGSPSINKDTIQRMTVRAALWLTPKSVAGFNAAHFAELGSDQQLELDRLVKEFRELSIKAPPDTPATNEQYEHAKLVFSKLVRTYAVAMSGRL